MNTPDPFHEDYSFSMCGNAIHSVHRSLFTTPLWLIHFVKRKKWSPVVHLVTDCDDAHDGNGKPMKINLLITQMVEKGLQSLKSKQFVVSNYKTFKEHASMLSFGNFFRRVCLMNKLHQNNLPKTCDAKKAVVLLFSHALLDTHRRLINCERLTRLLCSWAMLV